MTKAWLTGADLTEAWLTRTNLTEAHVIEANLTRARLDGANLTQTQLGKALATHETTWPDGWDRTRRAAAGVDESDEEAPPAASPSE